MTVRSFVVTVGKTIVRDDIVDLAAQLAFYEILALFPFAIFLVTVLGFLPLPGLADQIFELMRAVMPGEAAKLFESTVRGVVEQKRSGLLAVALAGAVIAASSGLQALITSLDRAYEVKETRSWIRLRLYSIAFTLLGAVAVIVGTAALLLGPDFGHRVSAWLGLGGAFDLAWRWARWPVVLVAMSGMLAVLYYACPNVKQKFKYLTPGSVTAMTLLILGSLGFDLYATRLGNYNATYGTLGGGILLFTWIWIASLIVLVGGVMNAVIWRYSEEADKGVKQGATLKPQSIRGQREVGPGPDAGEEAPPPSTWLPGPRPA